MRWQHCGRLHDHDEHNFTAVQRVVVETCKCDDNPCTCRATLFPRSRDEKPRVRLRCPGKLVTEGAPHHMPTMVDL